MSARERIEFLLDENTIRKNRQLVPPAATDFGMAEQKFYGDGSSPATDASKGRLVVRFARLHRFRGIASEAKRRQDVKI